MPRYSSADVEKFGLSSALAMAGWRNRKIFDGWGEVGENGRWTYSGTELVALYLANVIEAGGQGRQVALMKGHQYADALVDWFNGRVSPARYLILFSGTDQDGGSFTSESLDDLASERFETANVIDLKIAAENAPTTIRSVALLAFVD